MAHDAHFLERLDRVRADETDLALGLYRDHELVRFILSHAKIPPEAERVAIALDHGGDGPWIVVAKEGAFVTCLGRGMSVKDLPTISRAQLDAWSEKHEEVRRRLAIAMERGARQGRLPARIAKQARWLSREDFIALTAVAEPIAANLLMMYLDELQGFTGALPHAAILGEANTEPIREVYTDLARSAWAMGHLALGITEAAGREFLSGITETLERSEGNPFVWGGLNETLAFPFLTRSAWCAAKMGKLALARYKALYARPTAPGPAHFDAAHALLAIAARHTSLRAEALKALEAQVSSEDEKEKMLRGWFREAAEAFERDPDAVIADALAFGRQNYVQLAPDLDVESKYRIEDPDLVPDDLAATAALNVWAGMSNAHILAGSRPVMLLAGRSKAEDFYFPAAVSRDLRINRTLGEGISLAALHRSRFPAHSTVRAQPKPGRNEPCSCGSGKKFKKCCGAGT